jgi:hypothetical protein
MALAWKAGWVNSPRGFESRILRPLENQALTCRNAVRITLARDGVVSNIKAASLSSGLNFRPVICGNPAIRRPAMFAAVR